MARTTDLSGLGMAPALATLIGEEQGVVNSNVFLKTVNAAGTGTNSILKTDASDNTVVNATTGKNVQIAVNSTAVLTASASAITTASNVTHTLTGTGAAATAGTFVCNGTTPVTVTTTAANANMIVIVSLNTVGGTVGAVPSVKTITAATNFTIAGTALDTSTYNWAIINRA